MSILVSSTLFCSAVIGTTLLVFGSQQRALPANTPPQTIAVIKTIPATPTHIRTPSPATPSATLIPNAPLKLLFGIGSQAGPAMYYPLVKESPVHMLTTWYNGSKDLVWMQEQKNDLIPRLYAQNFVVHLITWTDLPEETIQTPYGEACGRPYPVSTQILEDMKQLAQIYNGPGPMYVTLFTEFPTFTCTDNNWIGNENYYRTLKDNYRKIKDIFHEYAPNSKVALSWGGWIALYDDPLAKGGRSLVPYFDDVLYESDFTSFQTMESDTNIPEMLQMTTILKQYGKPIMLSHYKPSNGSHTVFDQDMKTLFTDQTMKQLIDNGLFAFSFMDDELLITSQTSYNLVKEGITKYGK